MRRPRGRASSSLPPRRRDLRRALIASRATRSPTSVVVVLDESTGNANRAMTLPPTRGRVQAWAPPPGYFRVLARAYARLGFDVAPLATAAGWSHERAWASVARPRASSSTGRSSPASRTIGCSRAPGSSRGGDQACVRAARDLGAFPARARRRGTRWSARCMRSTGDARRARPARRAPALLPAHAHRPRGRRRRRDLPPLAPEQVEGRPVIDSGNWRARRKETAT